MWRPLANDNERIDEYDKGCIAVCGGEKMSLVPSAQSQSHLPSFNQSFVPVPTILGLYYYYYESRTQGYDDDDERIDINAAYSPKTGMTCDSKRTGCSSIQKFS